MPIGLVLAIIELIIKLPDIVETIKKILEALHRKGPLEKSRGITKLAGIISKASTEHDTNAHFASQEGFYNEAHLRMELEDLAGEVTH